MIKSSVTYYRGKMDKYGSFKNYSSKGSKLGKKIKCYFLIIDFQPASSNVTKT